MFAGFVSMLIGLVLLGMARSTREKDQPRFTGRVKTGLLAGGGVLMAFGLLLCVGRTVQMIDVFDSL
ncbi:MAG: hypothetical protein ACI9VR_002373 [Cognaticolwellia sp.]|jgi:hypothetical protein